MILYYIIGKQSQIHVKNPCSRLPCRAADAKKVGSNLKNPFTVLREANRTYHSFRQSAKALLHRAETPLVASVILYRLATSVLFVPLMQQLWSLTLRFAPMHYLSNNNASDIFASPAIVGCIALIAILTAFWTLYEFSVLFHGLELARRGGKIRFGPLLRSSLLDIRHAFLPWNWPVLLYSAVLIPFTSFFLTSDYITQLAVPEYILGVIRANARYHALYAAACILILLLCLTWVLVLPLFVLERRSLWQSVKESVCYVRRRLVRVFLLLARWNLSAVFRAALLSGIVILPLYGVILAVGMQSTQAMFAMSRASLLIELPFFQFLIDCSITAAQCSILALLYHHLRGHVPFELEQPVSGRRWRTSGKAVIAASIAGATVLTLLLSLVYLVLPKDDELLSLLGGTAPVITSHRGYSSAAPENTLPAFQLAIDHGSDRAELDVQMTKDGVVMVTHDASLRRCTGRNAYIYDLTYDEVRKLDAGRWFSAKYSRTKIPTLEEVLDLCKGKIQLNIEIKPNAATPELEAETVRIIREKGFEKDCVITSQSYETLCKVKELDPEIETGYILALGVGSFYDLPEADFFSVEATFITSGMVQQIHKRGKTISAWTVNREEDASNMLSLGVDDVITDKPEMVQELISEDTDLNDDLLLIRDTIRGFFAAPDEAEQDPAEEVIEDAIENPDELLNAA